MGYARVHRRKVDVRKIEQVVKVLQHEVGFLKVVDAVVGAHHALQFKLNAVG